MELKEFKSKIKIELNKKGWCTDTRGINDLLNDIYESETVKNLILFGVKNCFKEVIAEEKKDEDDFRIKNWYY